MSIRTKLILTYVIMVIVSATLVTIAGMGLMANIINDVVSTINSKTPIQEVFYSAIDVLADFKQAEKYDPDEIYETSFMESINKRIEGISGFLVTEIDGDFHSFGNEELSENFYSNLELVQSNKFQNPHEGNNIIKDNNRTFAVYKYVFENAKKPTNYYLVMDITDINVVLSKDYGIDFLKGLVFLIVIIIIPIILITTKDITQPLKKLEFGVNNIKEGNLDFSVTSKNRNEIGRVIRAFDKMRSELKKSIDNQLQSEKNRKELISNISHDLKTPITSIKGYVEGIKDGIANSPEKLEKYLDVIYHKSEDMDRLIDDLFLFSKLDLKKVPFDLENVNLYSFYQSCLEELHIDYDNKGITITESYDGLKEQMITMDAQKIKRVIINIVNNAIKYMDKDNKLLNIQFEVAENELLVRITDNGKGIDPKDVEKVFERFYRTDPARNSETGGSGLGLAIAKQIITQHGGNIYAKSEIGKWTMIEFSLPL